LVSKDAAFFAAGALSGAAAKKVTMPLDRIKLIMQTHGLRLQGTYPLDVLRLRLAVDPGYQTTTDVCLKKLKEEGLGSSLIGIAPYVAVNFCVFDLVKKSLPEKFRNRPEASILTAFVAASIATLTCYPLDTFRRQMQMRAIVARDGVAGLYRGFVPNALKTLPNSSIKLTTFDSMKRLISAIEIETKNLGRKPN
nr:probable envelope ADP,ATP carrier protein, chloroplastic [Tanacetum cinerariifolium]